MKKKGFTLVEVLIVVGVIGIIAGFLIPMVQETIFKHEMKEKLKIAQSIISQGVLGMKQDNMDVSLVKIYGDFSSGVYPYCAFATDFTSHIIGPKNYISTTYDYVKSYSNQLYDVPVFNYIQCPERTYGTVGLQNGMSVMFDIDWTIPFIAVDLNGQKKPNRLGFDVFKFQIDSKDQVQPVFRLDSTSDRFRCEKDGTGQLNGYNCTMWALQDKCPDGSDQGYWECLP